MRRRKHTLFTVHSLSTEVPDCPAGTSRLWEGYSFLYMMADLKAHGQDLGEPGSCLRAFSTLPYMFCEQPQNADGNCRYASRNDYSYWLNTDADHKTGPIQNEDIERFISRCSVCETDRPIMAIHSQSEQVPNCPRDWETMWIGFSFLMVSFESIEK